MVRARRRGDLANTECTTTKTTRASPDNDLRPIAVHSDTRPTSRLTDTTSFHRVLATVMSQCAQPQTPAAIAISTTSGVRERERGVYTSGGQQATTPSKGEPPAYRNERVTAPLIRLCHPSLLVLSSASVAHSPSCCYYHYSISKGRACVACCSALLCSAVRRVREGDGYDRRVSLGACRVAAAISGRVAREIP